MGYIAKLNVFNQSLDVICAKITYHRRINPYSGRPAWGIMGGYISLTLPSSSNDILTWWMFYENEKNKEYCLLTEGSLDFYKDSFEEPIAFSYEFQDAFIRYYREEFSADSETPMQIHIVISAAIQYYKGGVLIKSWRVSPLPPKEEPVPYQAAENTDPVVREGYFTTLQGKKIPKDQLKVGSEVYYVIETQNAAGEHININLADAKNDFKHKGELLINDLLENVQITSDTQKVKLEVIRQSQNT